MNVAYQRDEKQKSSVGQFHTEGRRNASFAGKSHDSSFSARAKATAMKADSGSGGMSSI